jgi:PAS domain S-box-containing protein
MYLKAFLLIVFLAINALIYFHTEKETQAKIDYSKQSHMNKLQINYEVFMLNQSNKADVIYKTIIANKKVLELLTQAKQTTDKATRSKLRAQFHTLLQSQYQVYKDQGVLQFHFVLPDNTSFLRFHKPNKFGDVLSSVRTDFAKVNKTHKVVRGFSQGRTAHAFRNVYPIFNAENEYIGAMEISYPSELLQQNLNQLSEIHSHFLVNKDIFESKMWQRDDRVLHYTQSIEHKDYLLTMSNLHGEDQHLEDLPQRIKNVQDQIDQKINGNMMFSVISNDDADNYVILSFYPIPQNVTYQTAAWLVAYDDAPIIYPAIRDNYIIRLITLILSAITLFFLYKLKKQSGELRTLLNSYDDNVIFSTTDTYGVITHVSKAFCEISGYEEEELLGRPHNIIRHPDMPQEAFEDMWKTIKEEKTWRGEVKNLKKDGGFYWVYAEVEPLYNENNHLIGYSATRHDITHKKEIENIQKEVIFTMGSIGESRSQETANHVKRVAEYSKVLALSYGLSINEVEILEQASPMHDIGKVGIPDAILNKPGKLTSQEFEVMKTHVDIGYKMLQSSERTLLKSAAIVAHEHHEKWDGSGYPRGLKGEEIHIYGRITALADVFDALGSDRCYKKAWDDEKVFSFLREESGKHFDPKLIELFFENIERILEIRNRFSDRLTLQENITRLRKSS